MIDRIQITGGGSAMTRKIYIEGKPVKLSPWARWVAMDANGRCCEFDSIPVDGPGAQFFPWTGSRMNRIGIVREPSKYDWRKTRTEVPR